MLMTIIKLTYDKGVIATYLDSEDHVIMGQVEAEVLGGAQTMEQVKDLIAADIGCSTEDLAIQDGCLDGGRTIYHSHSQGEGGTGTLKWEVTDEDDFCTTYLVNF